MLLAGLVLSLAAAAAWAGSCPSYECYCMSDQIDCSDMQFKYLPEWDLVNETFALLDLSKNKFKRLESGALEPLAVRKVKLFNNRRQVEVEAGFLKGLEGVLTRLDFRKSKIPTLPTGLFRGQDRLKHITLDDIGLTSVFPENFRGASTALDLSLEHNLLAKLPARAFAGLRGLEKLFLADNQLRDVDSLAFKGLKQLSVLCLQRNNIRDLQPKTFKRLPSLVKLDLFSNEITALFPLMFKGLTSIEELNLADNPIMLIADHAFVSMASLQELHLDGAKLSYVKPAMFKGLKKLRTLHLDHNNLADLPDGLFAHAPTLARLHLQNNDLTTVNPCAFADVRNVKEINAWNNRVHCDCSLKWASMAVAPRVLGRCQSPDKEQNSDIDDPARYTVCTFTGMECGKEAVADDVNTPLKFWLRYRRAYKRSPYFFYGKR